MMKSHLILFLLPLLIVAAAAAAETAIGSPACLTVNTAKVNATRTTYLFFLVWLADISSLHLC